MTLSEKRILVTGASRGIGRAIAVACASRGALVGVGYRESREKAEDLAREVGGSAIAIDVADAASVHRAIAEFGRLDAFVANAGVHVANLLATTSDEDLRRVVDANVLGPLLCARAALPVMLAQKSGVLLFIGSVAASRPSRGQAAYAATKASVEALARAIGVEYGRKGIRAVCLRPGPIATDMLEATRAMAEEEIRERIPAQRIGRPEEIAAVAAMLLSDEASFVNGAVIDVDGGYGAA